MQGHLQWLCLLALWCFSGSASASLYETFAAKYGLDPYLIKAVAYVESQGKPWTINMDGLPVMFDNKRDAVAFVQARQDSPWYVAVRIREGSFDYQWFSSPVDAGVYYQVALRKYGARNVYTARINPENVDIGLMQINWRQHREHARLTLEELFDPILNMDYASGLLADLIHKNGAWKGIALYHSKRPVNQSIYTKRIWKAYQGLLAADRDLQTKVQDTLSLR
jgi:hypothetical protein